LPLNDKSIGYKCDFRKRKNRTCESTHNVKAKGLGGNELGIGKKV